jgi:hypothetical protein
MNGYGNSVFLRTAWEVSSGVAPVNTVAPAITGTAQEGQTVTCSTGTWTGTPTITFAYQWKRNGSNIGSATNSTYVLVTADVSQSITCQVTATNGSGSASATSNTITPIAAVDPDAQAFITAAAITNPTQQSAINTLVVDLKAYSIWSKMNALYPFVGSTASQQKFNLKDPRDLDAAFRLTFFGGGTHSVNGYLPNGTNAYADTFLKPSTSLTLNSSHLSVYSRTTGVGGVDIGGAANSLNPGIWILNNLGGGTSYVNSNGTGGIATTLYGANTNGFFINNRTISTELKFNRNAVSNTILQNSSALTTVNISIGALTAGLGFSFYSNRQIAIASIGSGLSDTEAANFYTAVQAFQTTLGRQV